MLLGLARSGIRPVTMKTMFGENRADLVVVGQRFTGGRGGAHTGKKRAKKRDAPTAFSEEDAQSLPAKAVFFEVLRTTQ
jgi:hypothetical protein